MTTWLLKLPLYYLCLVWLIELPALIGRLWRSRSAGNLATALALFLLSPFALLLRGALALGKQALQAAGFVGAILGLIFFIPAWILYQLFALLAALWLHLGELLLASVQAPLARLGALRLEARKAGEGAGGAPAAGLKTDPASTESANAQAS